MCFNYINKIKQNIRIYSTTTYYYYYHSPIIYICTVYC